MGIHYTVLQQKEREGKGVVVADGGGEIETVTKLWKRQHENWKAKGEKSQNNGGKEELLGGGGWGLERVSVKPLFELPAENVQLHLITWEGQQRCSFPMATSYAPIYPDQQRLIILFSFLSPWHHTCVLLLSSSLSHLKSGKQKRTKGWRNVETLF